ncbi:MAG TPA: ABC transporter permease subunit [Symbiobacteriaceae bacterium]|nr:ABC transporter permease subunit [Symbiobacteriaceae bacterium]
MSVRPWLLVGPAVAVLGGLFVIPLLVVASGPTLSDWRQAAADPELLGALWLSLRVAAVSTVISLAAGFGLAVLLQGSGRLTGFLARFPLVVPHLVVGYTVLLFLGRSGLLARLAYAIGLIREIDQFPVLVHDAFGWGIIFAYVWKEAPFIALLVLPLLGGGTTAWREAARTLGARPWQALRYVVLPLTWPALAAGGAIIFAYSFGAFELPLILGRSYPRALPVLAYERYVSPDLTLRPEAMAIALLMALVSLASAGGYLAFLRKLEAALASVRRDEHA